MHFGELELQSILASSPPSPPSFPLSESGTETATPQSHQRHMAAIHMGYDDLCVGRINIITPFLTMYTYIGWVVGES